MVAFLVFNFTFSVFFVKFAQPYNSWDKTMSKSIICRWSFLFLIVLSTGCAGSGPGKSSSGTKSYSAQIGISYRAEIFGVTEHILLNKYRYQVSRQEESPRQIYFETAWKERSLFADEVEMRIMAAQTRIILRATARHIGQYKIHLYAENEFQYEESEGWHSGLMSKELKQYFDRIAGDLRHEFRLLY